MPPKRNTRSSTKSKEKDPTKSTSNRSSIKAKPTKTQMQKQRKAVRERKARIQTSKDELKALKKKHADEQKAMEKMIKEAQNMATAIHISSDDDDSSHNSSNSASSQSDSTITDSAFAKNSQSRNTKRKAARKQQQLKQHLEALDEGKGNEEANSDEQSDFDNNQSTKSSKTFSENQEPSVPTNGKEAIEVQDDGNDEVQQDDATIVGKKNVTKPSRPSEEFVIPKRKHIVYCKGKITVPKSDPSNEKYSASERLRKTFMSFMTTLMKIDKRLLIFEHNDCKNKRYICSPQQIPETPTNIQTFFDGNYRPGPTQQIIWFQVKIGLDIPEESNFFLDAKCLFDDKKKHAIYRKDLQVPVTETIGYFLYSHGKQNRDRLMETLNYLLRECYKIKYPISVRWQKIVSKYSAKGNQKKDSGKEIESKAYHIEVVEGRANVITKAIAHMYSSKRKCPPQKEKMRFVPYPKFVTNTSTKIQYNLIKNMQGWFIAGTSFASSFDISDLDEVYDGLPNLRDFIMEMQYNGEKLFTSVDFSFNGKCVLFVFPTDYENEAHNKIADLPSYAMYKHGLKFLQKYFHPEAYERAEQAPWNEEEGRAVSQLSEEFDAILKECANFSWLRDPNSGKESKVEEKSDEVEKPTLFNRPRPNDDASLDTFGVNTEDSNKRSVTPEKDPHLPRKKKKSRVIGSDVVMNQVHDDEIGELTDDDEEAMDVDEVTVSTLNSRMHNIENSFQNLNDNIASTIQAQFATYFQNNQARNPPGTVSPSKTAQPTSTVEGPQVTAPPASTGGVDC